MQSVNAELIKLYWNVGKYLSIESTKSTWGDSFIDETAKYIKEDCPEIKGFNRRGLYRMRQFYETYKDNEFVSPIALTEHAKGNFLDRYVLEFLDLPDEYSENDLQKAIIHNLKDFVLEIGKDFSFVGEEYRVQVGGSDFYIDLLFYHRGLSCLVAFELKIGKFKPEYIGKMNFYLETLDRDYKKPNENPSIGVILCTTKDDDVVEYAMSRNLSPTLVSEYTLQLIDKKLLEQKLREYKELLPEDDSAEK